MTECKTTKRGLVLLVDDNENMSLVVQNMLEIIGFDVECAYNGRDAVKMTIAKPYLAVLMDIEMPEMDGLEATKAIRQVESQRLIPPTPILGISGHTSLGMKMLGQMAGMSDFLLKPFLMEHLEERLLSACNANLN